MSGLAPSPRRFVSFSRLGQARGRGIPRVALSLEGEPSRWLPRYPLLLLYLYFGRRKRMLGYRLPESFSSRSCGLRVCRISRCPLPMSPGLCDP